jgi:DNA topoisomerase VI subunit B
MILRKQEEVETHGINNTNQFQIKASSHAFRILSDGLYSDKISSIIRELSCNALDSHIANGNPEIPFQIHIPSKLIPHFHIRDYGIGLSEEDIMGLYSTYFASTKGQSNDFVGALGLGSKSPFSYTDSFTVESWFNNEKKTYAIFIGDEGVQIYQKYMKNHLKNQVV